jgi:hypothetical protein
LEDYVGNRLTARIPYKLKIRIKGRNFKETAFTTADVSVGGVYIPSDSAPTLNLPIDIKLYLPSAKNPLKIRGKVLRIKWMGNFKKIVGFAVEFTKFDRATEDKYLNFLNKISKGEY